MSPGLTLSGPSGQSTALKELVKSSQETYRRDLKALFEHASDRFGDVKWEELDHDFDGLNGREAEGGFEAVDFALESRKIPDQTQEEVVWAHKAVIYSRASKSFKSRFFPSNSSSSQASISRPPSTAPSATHLSVNNASMPRYTRSSSVLSNRPRDAHGVTTLSQLGMREMLTIGLEGMYDPDSIPGSSAYEAGEHEDEGGMEWLLLHGNEGRSPDNEGLGLGLGIGLDANSTIATKSRIGDSKEDSRIAEIRSLMREKQSQDLTYMWRSKLYADVLIQVPNPAAASQSSQKVVKPPPSSFRQTPVIRRATSFSSVKQNAEPARSGSSLSFNVDLDRDLGFEVDEETGLMTFSAHRFMLCSRSPYFAQVLLNAGEFQPHTASATLQSRAAGPMPNELGGRLMGMPIISLSSPPFTPQAMHFILGYIYSGSLGKFSNKQLDMSTALLVRKGATYLEMEALEKEVEGRLIWEFAHGIAWDERMDDSSSASWGQKVRACRCRKCLKRIPRLLRFATSPDVYSTGLKALTMDYVVRGWSECLGKDIAMLQEDVRDDVTDQILNRISPQTIIDTIRGLLIARKRLESEGKSGQDWFDEMEDILDMIAEKTVQVMTSDLDKVFASKDALKLVAHPMMEYEVLETVMNLLIQGTGRVEYCRQAPLVYQMLVVGLLNRTDLITERLVLPKESRARQIVEDAREGLIGVVRKRWMQIRQEDGFSLVDERHLQNISEKIHIEPEALLQAVPKRKPAVSLNSAVSSRTTKGFTNTVPLRPRVPSLDSRQDLRLAGSSVPRSQTAPKPLATQAGTRIVSAPHLAIDATSASSTSRIPARRAPMSGSANSLSLGRPLPPPGAVPKTTSLLEASSGNKVRLPRLPIGVNAQAGPSERNKAANGSAAQSAPRQRALSTPGKQTKITQTVAVPPLPANTISQPVTQALTGQTENHNGHPARSEKPNTASDQPSRPGGEQGARGAASIPGKRLTSRGDPLPIAEQTPSATPNSSPDRRTPTKTTSGRKVPDSPVGPKRSPLTPRDKVPPMPLTKPTASTLAKKVSTASIGGRKVEEQKKALPKSTMTSSVRGLRTSPVPSRTTGASKKPESSIPRVRVASTSIIRPRVDSDVSTAGRIAATVLGNAPTNSQLPVLGKTITDIPRRQKELSETTDDTPVEAVTPSMQSDAEDGLLSKIQSRVQDGRSDTLESAESRLIPTILEPSPRYSSALRGIDSELPDFDFNSTLPRSFGSQLDHQNKLVLGLPVPSETRRPSLQMIRTPSAGPMSPYESQLGRYHPAAAFDPPPRVTSASTPVFLTTPADDGIPLVGPEYGSSLSVGIPCIVALSLDKVCKFKALARYIGRLQSSTLAGEWVGVEVEARLLDKSGVNETEERFICDGVLNGCRYFSLNQHPSALSRPSHGNVGQSASLRGRVRGGSTIPSEMFSRRGMRSASASPVRWQVNPDDTPPPITKALFVRPSEVVFVLGTSE